MRSFRVVSLWDMLQISPRTMPALAYIAGCQSEWRLWVQLLRNAGQLGIYPPDISLETRALFLHYCQVLGETASELGMKASRAAADRVYRDCLQLLSVPIGHDAHRLARIAELAEQLLQVFNDEVQGQQLLTLSARYTHLFATVAPFGETVENAFPGAAYDVCEAAKCLALGRWTASVMHVMRAMDVGLTVLAKHHGVVPERNCNQAINEIEAKTREVAKRSHGAEAEQWAAEAATHLRFVKNAWRNQAMHPLEKYDEDRAVVIFESCRAFMQHLATKLSEDS